MTGGAANLVNFEQERVGIAVEVHFLDLLHVARFFPLAPETLAATAEIHGPGQYNHRALQW